MAGFYRNSSSTENQFSLIGVICSINASTLSPHFSSIPIPKKRVQAKHISLKTAHGTIKTGPLPPSGNNEVGLWQRSTCAGASYLGRCRGGCLFVLCLILVIYSSHNANVQNQQCCGILTLTRERLSTCAARQGRAGLRDVTLTDYCERFVICRETKTHSLRNFNVIVRLLT